MQTKEKEIDRYKRHGIARIILGEHDSTYPYPTLNELTLTDIPRYCWIKGTKNTQTPKSARGLEGRIIISSGRANLETIPIYAKNLKRGDKIVDLTLGKNGLEAVYKK